MVLVFLVRIFMNLELKKVSLLLVLKWLFEEKIKKY